MSKDKLNKKRATIKMSLRKNVCLLELTAAMKSNFATLRGYRVYKVARIVNKIFASKFNMPEEIESNHEEMIHAAARLVDFACFFPKNKEINLSPSIPSGSFPTDADDNICLVGGGTFENKHVTIKNSIGVEHMADMTELDYGSLKEFEETLSEFLKNVSHQCDKMESGINYSKGYMKDESSDRILRKSNDIVNRIRDCIDPAKKTHQKLVDLLRVLESANSI